MVWVDTSQYTCGHVGGYAGYIAVLIAWFGCNLVVSSKLHNTTHICIGSRVAIICRHCNNCGNEKPARAWKLIQHTWINTLKCSCGLLCESFPAVTRLTVYRRPQVCVARGCFKHEVLRIQQFVCNEVAREPARGIRQGSARSSGDPTSRILRSTGEQVSSHDRIMRIS